MNNRGKEILDEFLKEDSAYSLRYSFNGDIVRDKDLFRDYLRELEQRIDKAIKYINSNEMLKLREDFEYCNDKDLFDGFVGHLDRVLRGSDK